MDLTDIVKVQAIKETLYAAIPAELARKLGIVKGDRLLVFEARDGVLYRKQETGKQ
jgi:bifunctional DNA-binding transcriptional regulator/antitoxin component of YhaV-PrlF toxin-antitoxin module